MFGVYYLGQYYLGESGFPSNGSISIQNSEHNHTSDNITLYQKHILVVDNTTNTISSDNIVLSQYLLLNQPDSCVFMPLSPIIGLSQTCFLEIGNNTHLVEDSLKRVVSWTDYNVFSGVYIDDFGSYGNIDYTQPETGVLIVNKDNNTDTLTSQSIESGVYIADFNSFGNHK